MDEAVLTPIPVLTGEQQAVAARFLREAANPPYTPQAAAAFRYRWGAWLFGWTPGPRTPGTLVST